MELLVVFFKLKTQPKSIVKKSRIGICANATRSIPPIGNFPHYLFYSRWQRDNWRLDFLFFAHSYYEGYSRNRYKKSHERKPTSDAIGKFVKSRHLYFTIISLPNWRFASLLNRLERIFRHFSVLEPENAVVRIPSRNKHRDLHVARVNGHSRKTLPLGIRRRRNFHIIPGTRLNIRQKESAKT